MTLRDVALFGVLGALTFGLKVAMSFLPNIEPTSLLVMVYAVVFGRKALYPIYLYVALEILFYGIQLWNINYLYVWLILALGAWMMRKTEQPLAWALLGAVFGLFFGALCAPVYLFTGGPAVALSWWISGIPFDLLHCGGNFVMVLVLFKPLRRLLTTLYTRLHA
ncbi:MAG: hypothetical protein IJO31_04190 [Oscillospiraceae bacterium]|nr:hypothetical protein [Oscillospiraceae bacterium]